MNPGEAFNGITQPLMHHSVRYFSFFANMPGLATEPIDKASRKQIGPDNLCVASFLLRRAGFFMKRWNLQPKLFGVP